MWDLKIDTRRLVEGFSTSVPWDRPNVLWNKADDWWNDNYVTDSNTAAFLSATGIIDPNKQNYINNLVIALKNQGIWNKAKAIYPFVSEQRNLLNYTEDFSNIYWSVNTATKTPNYGVAPDGTTTASRFYGGGYMQTTGVPKEIGTYVFSFYVKMSSGSAGTLRVFLDGGITTTTVNVTGIWTRVQISQTFSSTLVGTEGFYVDSDVLIWHPQLELGSTATDYQVTINAQEQFAAAYKYNLKDPQDTDAAFRLKIFGTWTFTPTGAKPNGTNAYMDTLLLPSLSLTNNSTALSYYSRSTSAANTGVEIGAAVNSSSLPLIQLACNYTGLGTLHDQYSYYEGRLQVATANSYGFFCGSRTSSTSLKGYKNGSLVGTLTTSSSQNVTGIYRSLTIGAVNAFNPGISAFSNRECAFASIGDGLTDAEAAALYTIVQQFQTALNRQV
jgi:hypothetical protein